MITYIKENIYFSIVGSYLFLSSILKATIDVDICIPCIWKTMFGFACPGCGLTSAFINLMKLDFNKAFESNWLIFIVIPFALYYLAQDYVKHSRKYNA